MILCISTVSLFLNCCGTVKTQADQLNISINHSDIYSWLNLMPGGPPSFHITGNLTIKNEESYEIKELNLNEIILTQQDIPLYHFEPLLEPVNENISGKNLEAGEEKEFRFGVKSGLEVKPELDSEKPITARLVFNSGEKIFEYVIYNIQIEKAY
ncbi:MAG: hypothetical protein Q7S39_07455 [Ignavibacteria bacterium]|nr:hypothetical protein [Ignavibacteria bacterium]